MWPYFSFFRQSLQMYYNSLYPKILTWTYRCWWIASWGILWRHFLLLEWHLVTFFALADQPDVTRQLTRKRETQEVMEAGPLVAKLVNWGLRRKRVSVMRKSWTWGRRTRNGWRNFLHLHLLQNGKLIENLKKLCKTSQNYCFPCDTFKVIFRL